RTSWRRQTSTCTSRRAPSPRTGPRGAGTRFWGGRPWPTTKRVGPAGARRASLRTNKKVGRDGAMTGEITLRGNVLPVGGVKEKLLAAHRAGIKRVILPERNVRDLCAVPEQARRELEIIPVKKMDELLALALTELPDSLKGILET